MHYFKALCVTISNRNNIKTMGAWWIIQFIDIGNRTIPDS